MNKEIVVAGKRKTSVAKVRIGKGRGVVLINSVPYENLEIIERLTIQEPIEIYKNVIGNMDADIRVNILGGGKTSQIQAARLGIAKALVEFSKSADLKKAFSDYDRALLVADVRRKEQRKPGDSKARAKRQKSYR